MRADCRWIGFVAVVFLALPTAGQAPAAAAPSGPRFTVVSIKVDNSGHNGSAWGNRCASGRWRGKNVNVATLIITAYGIAESQVEGIPAWNTRPLHQFDITAICPAGTVDSQLAPMLRAMLAHRFGFKAHFETREMAVRTLQVAKGGSKLKLASGHCVEAPSALTLPEGEHRCGQFYPSRSGPGRRGLPVSGQPMVVHYQAWSATTADFVKYFGWFGRMDQPPMVDETGLTGKYDFDFQYQLILNLRDAQGHPVDQEYKIVQAMRDQLGLMFNDRKLTKEPMPVLVIDHIAMPTPN